MLARRIYYSSKLNIRTKWGPEIYDGHGIWAMEDRLYRPKDQPHSSGFTYLHGFGHYYETYVRGPTGWRIKTTRLTRLRVEHV
jgi:hypothetical protein